MIENDISHKIRGAVFKIYNATGPGLPESVYQTLLKYQLEKDGLKISSKHSVPIIYKDAQLETDLNIDCIVNEQVIVEIKAVEHLMPIHHKEMLTYLRLTDLKLGLLINFNTDKIDAGIKRIINDYKIAL